MSLRELVRRWPARRQLSGDLLGLGRAARSRRSEQLRPRTAVADSVTQSICPYCDVLRRLQALHARRLPRRLPHGLPDPHRARDGRRPGGRLQRCGYCVPACPFGVLDRRKLPSEGREEDGRVWKCTLCYDRTKDGLEPACSKACPTDSIQFGPLDELRARADDRVARLREEGWTGAQLYGRDPEDGVGGFGAFFLLLDRPEVYRLPPDPVAPTRHLPAIYAAAAAAALALAAGVAGSLLGSGR